MTETIEALEKQITELKEQLATARKEAPPQEVADHGFESMNGPVRLSDLFGEREDLFVVHNMGRGCRHCTMWADGLNGLVSHFQDRAAFVVCTPDKPEVQRDFAASRGWKFDMVSDQSKEFSTAMGYWLGDDGWWPGMSAFRKSGGKIYRTGKTFFGPGDDFCGIYPAMELLGGDNGWEPKFKY